MQVVLDYLTQYAETILRDYRDPYHGTPLFFDGCDLHNKQAVAWKNTDGRIWQPSNIASQQNLFRFFVGLSNITQDPKYKQAAQHAIQWHFDHADSSGLIRWGGHSFIDLKTLDSVGPENKNMVHELKHHCPFYELMYETDPTATRKLIKAIWNTHVTDWQQMAMSRHGQYGLEFDELIVWDKPKQANLSPLREMKGLSFVNIGNDLVFSAGMLYAMDGDEKALSWAEHLMNQYFNCRHPDTQLGCYQYNQPLKTGDAPIDEHHPQYTFSFWGDRAQRQFGPEYGDVAKEAWVLFKVDEDALNGPEGIYGDCALAQTLLARDLGTKGVDAKGKQLLNWTTQGLEAWAKYAYDHQTNEIKPMFADGKDLTGHKIPRFGYYGQKSQELIRRPLPVHVFLAYVTNWCESQSEALWQTVCAMAQHFGLGNWQTRQDAKLDGQSDPLLLFASLEMYRTTQQAFFLALADQLANKLFEQTAHQGLFTPSSEHLYCRFDDVPPLALLTWIAHKNGTYNQIPVYRSRGGYIHGDILLDNGEVKNIMDVKFIYEQKTTKKTH